MKYALSPSLSLVRFYLLDFSVKSLLQIKSQDPFPFWACFLLETTVAVEEKQELKFEVAFVYLFCVWVQLALFLLTLMNRSTGVKVQMFSTDLVNDVQCVWLHYIKVNRSKVLAGESDRETRINAVSRHVVQLNVASRSDTPYHSIPLAGNWPAHLQ